MKNVLGHCTSSDWFAQHSMDNGKLALEDSLVEHLLHEQQVASSITAHSAHRPMHSAPGNHQRHILFIP